METDLHLVRYEAVSEAQYLEYILEWEAAGERIVPAAANRKGRTFAELQQKWALDESEEALKAGFVPATLFFLQDGAGRLLGAIHLRHRLNEQLLHTGGHIGYGVRPTARGKGLATWMLNELLGTPQVRLLGRVLLTCDDDNFGSSRTIERCGGVLENKVMEEGVLERRYWIGDLGLMI